MPLLEWKWERSTLDFMVGLSSTQRGYDSIWVVVDKLTKSAHFILVKATYTVAQYVQLYIDHIVSLHGMSVSIISRISITLRFGRNYKRPWALSYTSA